MRLPPVLALAALVAACGVVSADTRVAGLAPPPDGPRCVDVAAKVGLDFRGDYGTVFPGDPINIAMQRNLGNGAAVGDYDGDGDLDVYLLGQGATPPACSATSSTAARQAPRASRTSRRRPASPPTRE